MRQGRRENRRRNPAGNIGLGCSALASLIFAVLVIAAGFTYADLSRDLPSIETLPALLDAPDGMLLQPTQIYDRSGEHLLLSLENPAAAGRSYVRYSPEYPASSASQIYLPESMEIATLAAMDPNFWAHSGSSWLDLLGEEPATLAQRLASDYLLEGEPPGLRRRLRERLLATQITERFGKGKVLEWYLNSADFGRLAYGVDAAARLYFGKRASELNLAEAAMLAAVADDPSLNPFDAPQAALERQKSVIQAMLRHRLVSPEEGLEAARQDLVYQQPDRIGMAISLAELQPNLAPAFAHLVLSQLETHISRSQIERGGWRITSTLDFDLQRQAVCAVAAQLAHLEAFPGETPDCQAARLLPTLPVETLPILQNLDGELAILDPASGEILALVGKPVEGPGGASLPKRPPGSMVTPVIYLTAFTRGMSPATLVWDLPPSGGEALPSGETETFHGPVRLRTAMANDYLTPVEQILTLVGSENAQRIAQQLGLPSTATPEGQEITLYTLVNEVDLVDLTRAFGIFANQGILSGQSLVSSQESPATTTEQTPSPPTLHPSSILKVEDTSGNLLLDWREPQTRPIITPQLAYLITHVLSDETARWPSLGHPNPLEIGRPAAVKAGGSEAGDSNWAIGYTPQLVAGVWLGGENIGQESGSEHSGLLRMAAAGIWHAIIQYASQDQAAVQFNVPSGISRMQVCDPSGLLPTAQCPRLVSEVFLSGSEPVQDDSMYRSIPINRANGRLATVFTPPDLVEQRAYFVVPSEASGWAQQSGIDTPPNEYDLIPANLATSQDAVITSPAMFATLRGMVPIHGTANGDQFVSYRLQVGQGMNPQDWLQVGEDVNKPVTQGKLGEWDTAGLNGLYAIQLLVLQEDQSVQRSTVLVTVDNLPPHLEIINPQDGEEIEAASGESIVLQVNVEDELGSVRVDLYMDGELLTTLIQPPYALSWELSPGAHTLHVTATDLAGNVSEAESQFSVK
jgi:membrane carboxypeptidase/penicillin-binding protein